jgi:HSP20 family molecular chaperone IbpA
MPDVMKRESHPLAEWLDWLDGGWPGLAELRRSDAAMRIEDRWDEDKYVVRAELPGVDPDKDVHITIANGILAVAAERRASSTEKGRSEFRYGSLRRRVTLPPGSQEDAVTAHYQDGILEITVPVAKEDAQLRTIPVARS